MPCSPFPPCSSGSPRCRRVRRRQWVRTPADDFYSANLDGTLSVPAPGLLDNDAGAGLQVTDVRPVAPPADYSLSWTPNGAVELAFTPQAGDFTFEYTVTASSGTTATAVINVHMGPRAPSCPGVIEANDDTFATPPGTPLDVAPPGVLGNDLVDSATGTPVVSHDGPIHGDLTINPDGSFTYTPPANFIGNDRFEYSIERAVPHGKCPDEALVVVTVA